MFFKNIGLYQCVFCSKSQIEATESSVLCPHCKKDFPVIHGIVDTLIQPSPDVILELSGLAVEAQMDTSQWQAVKVRKLDHVSSTEECLKQTAKDPGQYYQQVSMNFDQAFAQLKGRKFSRVLEIGAQSDYPFLKRFKELGSECFAVNIHFDYVEPDEFLSWPEKCLADMNHLPFKDGVFDLVYMSATSHHSASLEKTMNEISRVLKPDGVAILINDPVCGWVKKLGGAIQHGRHELVHENEYSIFKYHRAFKKSGFRPKYLFSEFHNQKLLNLNIHPQMRFARLGKLLSLPWRNPFFRNFSQNRLLWLAHIVFGFPLNVILFKEN